MRYVLFPLGNVIHLQCILPDVWMINEVCRSVCTYTVEYLGAPWSHGPVFSEG